MRNEDSKALKALLWVGIPFLVIGMLIVWFIIANRPPIVHVPSVKLPNPNGWDDFVKAGQMARATRPLGPYSDDNRKPQDWSVSELQSWVQAEKPALDMLKQGLPKQCVHPPARSYAALLTAESDLREMARVEAGAALYYDKVGEPQKAADSLLDGIEMGLMIQRGGILITGLVGTAIENIDSRHLEPLLPKLSSSQLAQTAERMRQIGAKRVPYGDILVEDSYMIAAGYAEMCSDPKGRLMLATDWNGCLTGFSMSSSGVTNQVKHTVSWSFANKAAGLSEITDYMQAVAKEQRGPYTGKSKVRVPTGPVASVVMTDYVRNRFGFVRNEAMFALLQTEVALLRYRADHGMYPNTLAELAPSYLKATPVDPFGARKPLRYGLTEGGKGYLLYSLGADLTDDHGNATKKPSILDRNMDIVAGSLSDKP